VAVPRPRPPLVVDAGEAVAGGGVSSMTMTSREAPEASYSLISLYETVMAFAARLRFRAGWVGGVGMAARVPVRARE
jgi:hypothetical protein